MLMLLRSSRAPRTRSRPAAQQRPPPTPLTEIGAFRALPACVPIVAHRTARSRKRSDKPIATLAIMVDQCAQYDFDKLNSFARRNAVEVISAGRSDSRRVVLGRRRGEEVADTPGASDPSAKRSFKAFADALGGALVPPKEAPSSSCAT